MKSSIIDQLNKLKSEALRFVEVSIEYAKFTAAEKFTMLGGMLVLGIVCLAMLAFVFIFLGFSCAELFKLFMPAALAYLKDGRRLFVAVHTADSAPRPPYTHADKPSAYPYSFRH